MYFAATANALSAISIKNIINRGRFTSKKYKHTLLN